MGIPTNHPAILQAVERGLIAPEQFQAADTSPSPPAEELSAGLSHERHLPELVEPSFIPPGCWVLPITTASEANGREWRKRSNRTQAARKVVSTQLGRALVYLAAFAMHYHAGGTLKVTLTRLGGHRLDRSNLPVALKSTEDALALMLGADDGDPRWQAEWKQEAGGPAGVRVELAAVVAELQKGGGNRG